MQSYAKIKLQPCTRFTSPTSYSGALFLSASEEMEKCHSFRSEILFEVMRFLKNVHVETESEGDNEAETSKYISFYIVIHNFHCRQNFHLLC